MRVSEALMGAVDGFLELAPETAEHLENTENPHAVTKAQVGLGNVDNVQQAAKTDFDAHTADKTNPHEVTKAQVGLGSVDNVQQAAKTDFDAHTADKTNPHEVTKAQVGLGNVDNAKQATKTEFDAHTADNTNPHAVTKAQVGLGSVDNVKQAAQSDYSAHIAGSADKHSGDDVLYSPSKSVTEKINELIIDGAGGTMYHDELLNRNSADAHPISAITGLSDKVDEVIIFEGTTTDDTPTLLTAVNNSRFLDENGRITLPDGYAADVEVTGVSAPISDGEISGNIGCCRIKFDGFLKRLTGSVSGTFSEPDVINSSELEDPTALAADHIALRYWGIKATGLDNTTLSWQAKVRLRVFSFES